MKYLTLFVNFEKAADYKSETIFYSQYFTDYDIYIHTIFLGSDSKH